jgi:hypothetical protein
VRRHLFLIALLSVLLPGTVLHGSRDSVAPPPFVSSLRAMPGAGRAMARTQRSVTACRPVRGVYIVPARRPKATIAFREDTPLQDRILERPTGLRAPPAIG